VAAVEINNRGEERIIVVDYSSKIKAELGKENFKIYNELIRIRQMTNTSQTRLPFEFFIH